MRKLEKPKDISAEVFLECISIVKNANLKKRLTACTDLITNATTEFDEKVTKGQLFTVARETVVNGDVTAKELMDVYTLRMAKKNTPGRVLYDRIKLSSPYGICPLCSQREATSLDHYLPKAEYPRLSIVSINLVPACTDCNKSKLVNWPKEPEEETIHPYYDDIENILWLKATVIKSTPPSIKFSVETEEDLNELLSDRIKFHFKSLSLNILYGIQAASELRQINFRLITLFNQSGAVGVRNYLLEGVETRSHNNINSWQTALYKEIANNEWFCNGGFKLQP